ncbi:MAG: hypothetical protein ACM3UU_07970 [Ignavibacteriales bacterium]
MSNSGKETDGKEIYAGEPSRRAGIKEYRSVGFNDSELAQLANIYQFKSGEAAWDVKNERELIINESDLNEKCMCVIEDIVIPMLSEQDIQALMKEYGWELFEKREGMYPSIIILLPGGGGTQFQVMPQSQETFFDLWLQALHEMIQIQLDSGENRKEWGQGLGERQASLPISRAQLVMFLAIAFVLGGLITYSLNAIP